MANDIHVTRVSGSDVFGHTTDHCDESGCNGDELYFGAIEGAERGAIVEDPRAKFGYEVRTRDGWSAGAAGVQDESNCFSTREEAKPGIAVLAEALGISEDDIRVADLNNPRPDSVS